MFAKRVPNIIGTLPLKKGSSANSGDGGAVGKVRFMKGRASARPRTGGSRSLQKEAAA